jgi:two-component system, LuxR family, response regulator FixJ
MTRNAPTAAAEPTVFVVDDDHAVRQALSLLMRSVALPVETYASAQAFLDHCDGKRAGCVVLDIRMPGLSGLELQDEMLRRGIALPLIFITGHGDVAMAVRAMKGGAVDFIEKPFSDQQLLDRINQALERDRSERAARGARADTRARLALLTPREREVMQRIVAGQANKVIAIELSLSERTVEIHRAKVMSKSGARSLAELVSMVTRLGEGGDAER